MSVVRGLYISYRSFSHRVMLRLSRILIISELVPVFCWSIWNCQVKLCVLLGCCQVNSNLLKDFFSLNYCYCDKNLLVDNIIHRKLQLLLLLLLPKAKILKLDKGHARI